MVGNSPTMGGFPTTGWKPNHWLECQPRCGWNSDHLLNQYLLIEGLYRKHYSTLNISSDKVRFPAHKIVRIITILKIAIIISMSQTLKRIEKILLVVVTLLMKINHYYCDSLLLVFVFPVCFHLSLFR